MPFKLGKNTRSLMMNGQFAYHSIDPIEDIDNDPRYFDTISQDLIDAEKFAHDPLTSGLGATFIVIVGDPKAEYVLGTFRVTGVKTILATSGVKTFQLGWSRLGRWEHYGKKPTRIEKVA